MVTVRIAHLSDLHFGEKFDFALWEAVRAEVARFRPQLLIVTGDLVDDPLPIQLLAAKRELHDLAAKAEAQLYVVAGNHDVCRRGVSTPFTQPVDLFDRVFFGGDTTTAEAEIEKDFGGAPLGFTEKYRSARQTGIFKIPYEDLLPAAQRQEIVQRPEGDCNVLLALLDSNTAGQPLAFATGLVDHDDLASLRAKLADRKQGYLVRIAVVHHHVAPIAFTGGRWVGAESMMVLHNAGTVLALLAEHRFDLILHGHQHVPQFARLDIDPRDDSEYPIAIAAAGCCALKKQNDPLANSINFITVEPNGRIDVERFRYGNGRGPGSTGGVDGSYTVYPESFEAVKRRAFARAQERHSIRCKQRIQAFEVTEKRDLICEATLIGLRTTTPTHPHRRMHGVTLMKDSWFVESELGLDASVSSLGLRIVLEPEADPKPSRAASQRSYWVHFPPDSLRGAGQNYRVRHACANSVNLTHWECEERAGKDPGQADWNKGWAGFRVAHPLEDLQMTLKLPESLRDVEPYLRCMRPSAYPNYDIDENGDAVVLDAPDEDDIGLTKHESAFLRYDKATSLWRVDIRKPMVGYVYLIMWPTPGAEVNYGISSEVMGRRTELLEALDRASKVPGSWPESALKAFGTMADSLERLLAARTANEKRSVELWVYDHEVTALRPVMSRRSWTSAPMRADFEIPLGCGIAGASFQQGRVIPWARAKTQSPFIHPAPYFDGDEPAVEMRTVLAIPVFHESQVSVQGPPPQWSCIGVVVLGSSSDATKIPALFDDPPHQEIQEMVKGAAGMAHAGVSGMVGSLRLEDA